MKLVKLSEGLSLRMYWQCLPFNIAGQVDPGDKKVHEAKWSMKVLVFRLMDDFAWDKRGVSVVGFHMCTTVEILQSL